MCIKKENVLKISFQTFIFHLFRYGSKCLPPTLEFRLTPEYLEMLYLSKKAKDKAEKRYTNN